MKAIVAISTNNCIGYEDKIPWFLPQDLLRFKKLTTQKDCAIVMGRKTWDSLPRKPLPSRVNIVISNTLVTNEAIVITSIEELLKLQNSYDIWVIGGKQIYDLLKDYIEEWYITKVHKNVNCDTYLDIDLKDYHLIEIDKNITYSYERYKKMVKKKENTNNIDKKEVVENEKISQLLNEIKEYKNKYKKLKIESKAKEEKLQEKIEELNAKLQTAQYNNARLIQSNVLG